MIVPAALHKGDTIALISTARKIDQSDLSLVVEKLEEQGFLVKLGKHLLAAHHQFCGTDEQRALDLQNAINDQEIKVILCFRGGYGTVRILDKVDFTPLKNNPKWIAGYSDVTALHNALNNLGIASLHSTMPVNFKNNTHDALASLFASLSGEELNYQVDDTYKLNRMGSCQGKLVGGNLSMLYSLCGTKYDIDTNGCILFLEDLDEYLYHVDRMMQNLRLGGKLENLKGLIVGGMTDMNDNDTPFGRQANEIIFEAVAQYDYPVCFNFPAGHINDNRTLKFGVEAKLSISETGTLFSQ
jgi:muramoyltetrapeptide carboxypeptidase